MRPPSHVIGDLGQNQVAGIFKRWGWTADIVKTDYGEDVDCQVFLNGERTPFHFRCQVKSSEDADTQFGLQKIPEFSVPIAGKTCRNWLLAYYPVLVVVYDAKTETAFWGDASAQVRARVENLGAAKVSLRVPRGNVLQGAQVAIVTLLTAYYARILKIDTESVERTVYPVLMPGYRALSIFDKEYPFLGNALEKTGGELECSCIDSLPAWLTVLSTLDGRTLHGATFKSDGADLGRFEDVLFEGIWGAAHTRLPVLPEWLAFVCGPIQYSASTATSASVALARDLTGWTSLAAIGDDLMPDHEFAFTPPKGYVRQIGRRSRSWDGFFHVSIELDLAIQIHAGVGILPSDRLSRESLRQHMLGQYLPWECPSNQLNRLHQMLAEVQLVFNLVDAGENGKLSAAVEAGAICTPMFAPALGLIPQTRGWRELEVGSVKHQLEVSGMLGKLPGRLGDSKLAKKIQELTVGIVKAPPTQWLADESQVTVGLPIDIEDRRILVQRIRKRGPEIVLTEDFCSSVKSILRTVTADETSIKVDDPLIYEDSTGALVLSASWQPRIIDSTADSISKVHLAIAQLFDSVLPRAEGTSNHISSTINALRYLGELYFEGDQFY